MTQTHESSRAPRPTHIPSHPLPWPRVPPLPNSPIFSTTAPTHSLCLFVGSDGRSKNRKKAPHGFGKLLPPALLPPPPPLPPFFLIAWAPSRAPMPPLLRPTPRLTAYLACFLVRVFSPPRARVFFFFASLPTTASPHRFAPSPRLSSRVLALRLISFRVPSSLVDSLFLFRREPLIDVSPCPPPSFLPFAPAASPLSGWPAPPEPEPEPHGRRHGICV